MGVIVVGVDGSEGSLAALRWALAEAQLRGSSVRVVHAYHSPPLPVSEAGVGAAGGIGIPAVFTDNWDQVHQAVESEAANLIEHALREADADSFDGLEIERSAVEGPAARTLIAEAKGAELLVVASRGRGGFVGLLLGSVSQQCALHPPCPVVILPPPGATSGE
jgi:nucleotide-binding universal stress UspA family protein